MARQEWFSSQELAGLPGMPKTYSAVIRWAKKNLATIRSKPRGKGCEYARASLPEETQAYLNQRDIDAAMTLLAPVAGASNSQPAPALLPASPAAKKTALAAPARASGALVVSERAAASEAERGVELARRLALRAIHEIVKAKHCSLRAAAVELTRQAYAGELPAGLLAKLCQSRDRRGRKSSSAPDLAHFPSLVTLQRWVRREKAGEHLIPRSGSRGLQVRAWYAPFFALADSKTGRTLKKAHELLVENWRPEWADPAGSPPPSYDACARAYKKRSEIDKLAGRHTGSALKSKTFYYRRTYEGLAPFSEVHADGWNTHFTVPHPVHGRYVTREIWHAHDVATRWVPPFAIGFTETTDLILQCIRHSVDAGGQIAIFQTDSTKAVKGNERVMHELTGVCSRLGLTIVHPKEVGNSQANGIAENFNTWLDREARELATYQNPKVMDERTFVRMKRLTNQMVKAAGNPLEREKLRRQAIREGQGIVFDSDAEALAWIESKRVKWNNHPHRALPKIQDPATGRMRHMTPQESLDAARAAGWEPLVLPAEVLADAFRPHLVKKVTRGTVTPFGKMRYRHPALDALMGQEVQVAVDPDDYAKVWVKDMEGRLLCVAEHVPDVQGRSQSMRDAADARRAQARIRLRERQIEAIEQEVAPPPLLEMNASPTLEMPVVNLARIAEVMEATPVVPIEDEPQPEANNPLELYLRRRVAEKRAREAQDELEKLARIEAAMKAEKETPDEGESAAGSRQ